MSIYKIQILMTLHFKPYDTVIIDVGYQIINQMVNIVLQTFT